MLFLLQEWNTLGSVPSFMGEFFTEEDTKQQLTAACNLVPNSWFTTLCSLKNANYHIFTKLRDT